MKLFIGMMIVSAAQVLVWFQINAQFKWEWFRDHKFLVSLIFSVPVSVFFVYGTDYLYEAMGGKVWTVRLLTYGSSILSFYIMSSYFLGETLNTKTIICLFLSILIILIQVLWK